MSNTSRLLQAALSLWIGIAVGACRSPDLAEGGRVAEEALRPLSWIPLHPGPVGIQYGKPILDDENPGPIIDELGPAFVVYPVPWNQIEPAREGGYVWDPVDRAVESAEGKYDVVLTLMAVSSWATRTDATWTPSSPPTDMARYAAWVRATAERYRGHVGFYQIESFQPEGGWTGTPQEYVQMLRAAHTAIKSVDPGAQVICAGMMGETLPYLSHTPAGESNYDYIIRKGNPFFDILDVHFRLRHNTIPDRVPWYRHKMVFYVTLKSIWSIDLGTADPAVAEEFISTANTYIRGLQKSGLSQARDEIRSQIEWNQDLRGVFLEDYRGEWEEERVPSEMLMKVLSSLTAGVQRVSPGRLLSINPTYIQFGRETATLQSLRFGGFGLIPCFPNDESGSVANASYFPEVRRPAFDAFARIVRLVNAQSHIARDKSDGSIESFWLKKPDGLFTLILYSEEIAASIEWTLPDLGHDQISLLSEGEDLLGRVYSAELNENTLTIHRLPAGMPVIFQFSASERD